MAWNDRIQIAAYTSPSGIRFEFQYENVSISNNKKTTKFEFPEIDGQYIQDLGISGREMPFIIYFSGADYDIESNNFFAALEEKGIGTLEHPVYGTRKVVPTGSISRRDDLVSGANQAVFTITFSETIVSINFPDSELNDESNISNSADSADQVSADQYAETLVFESESENAELQTDLNDKKDIFNSALESLSSLNEGVSSAMSSINESLNNSILSLATNPGGIASQMITLINAPANIVTGSTAYLEGYGGVIDSLTAGTEISANRFRNSMLFVGACFTGIVRSILNAIFGNRPEAIAALNSITDLFENISEWIDDNITEFEIQTVDDYYETLNGLYSQISGYLVRLSFDLPKEIKLTLTSERNIIELVSELYNDIDMIDFFIQTNDLTTDEIELLPMGKEVVYYE